MDGEVAYASLPPREPTAYRDGWLDELHLVVSDPVAATIGHRLNRKLSELAGETTTRQMFSSRLRVLTL